jgi:integrase
MAQSVGTRPDSAGCSRHYACHDPRSTAVPRKETPTVREAIDRWLDNRVELSLNTIQNDRSVLNRFALSVGPDRQIGYVTASQAESYFRSIRHHKPASFNKSRARVALFLAYCQRHGWVRHDLLIDVGTKTKVYVERFRLSPIALVDLLEIPNDPRDRAFLALAMNTALRATEITGLRVKDADLDDGELYVYRSKSKRDDRMGITPMLDAELRTWLTTYANSIREPLDSDMWLFPARLSPQGIDAERQTIPGPLQPHVRLTHTERIVQRSLRLAGYDIRPQEGVHTIRRSVARAFFDIQADQGYDGALRNTAALLGHKSVVTTETYLGVSGDRRKRDQILRAQNFLPYRYRESQKVVSLHTAEA